MNTNTLSCCGLARLHIEPVHITNAVWFDKIDMSNLNLIVEKGHTIIGLALDYFSLDQHLGRPPFFRFHSRAVWVVLRYPRVRRRSVRWLAAICRPSGAGCGGRCTGASCIGLWRC